MIISPELVFVHVPKAGGMSLTSHLCRILPDPVWVLQPEGAQAPEGGIGVTGQRHGTAREALGAARELGVDLEGLKCIVAVMRNPYALEVSRFSYLRKGHPWDRGHNQNLALAGDFTAFAKLSHHHRPGVGFGDYIELPPEREHLLRLVHLESLAEDLERVLTEADVAFEEGVQLPHRNRSSHEHWRDVLAQNPDAASAIEARYADLFELGGYDRLGDPSATETGWKTSASDVDLLTVVPPAGASGAAVRWRSPDGQPIDVTVRASAGEPRLLARAVSGGKEFDWLRPERAPYVFEARTASGDVVAEVALEFADLSRGARSRAGSR